MPTSDKDNRDLLRICYFLEIIGLTIASFSLGVSYTLRRFGNSASIIFPSIIVMTFVYILIRIGKDLKR